MEKFELSSSMSGENKDRLILYGLNEIYEDAGIIWGKIFLQKPTQYRNQLLNQKMQLKTQKQIAPANKVLAAKIPK